MYKQSMKTQPYRHYIAVIFGTFVAAMLMNTMYQAERMSRVLNSDSWIAAFVRSDAPYSIESLRDRIEEIAGVKENRFVSREDALRKAIDEDSSVRDVMLSGDNPFPSYFLIRPFYQSPDGVSLLAQSVKSIDGIDEVRYDEKIFQAQEFVSHFKSFYKIELIAVFLVLLIVVIVKIIFEMAEGEANLLLYVRQALFGIIFGIIGAGLYLIVIKLNFPYPVVSFPYKYYLLLIPAGMLLNLVFKE